MVPIIAGHRYEAALSAARAMAGDAYIELVGLIPIPAGSSLSTAAAQASDIRRTMHALAADGRNYRIDRVHVTHSPLSELRKIVQQSRPALLFLDWPGQFEGLAATPAEVFAQLSCNIAAVGGSIPVRPAKLLAALRGGPFAELALRLSLAVAQSSQAGVTALHMVAGEAKGDYDAPYRGLQHVLESLPEIQRREIKTEDPSQQLLDMSADYDLVVMGATSLPRRKRSSIGPVADRLLRESGTGVIVVRSSRPVPRNFASEAAGQAAISVLVDKWFAENTYVASEFDDLEALRSRKEKQNLTVSVALPALNEQESIGQVIQTIRDALVLAVPLIDELVLVDSNSTDRTSKIAEDLGVPVHVHQQTLPEYGALRGKGEALWKSLYLTRGDIVLWIDTDILNIHPRFIYGLLGPLLSRPDVQLVKGYYRRPLRVGDKLQLEGGGRVTELVARPLLNLFYPELSGIVQPLAGEYGGRRSALEQLPFASGYGVEIGLLIDIFEKFGLRALAQVDLQERIHRNQTLEALGKMSFAIVQTVLRRLESRYGRAMLEDVNRTMKLIRYEPGHIFLEVEEIAEEERPPMAELPEYRQRFSL